MFSNRLGLAALGVACMAAAGIGGYVASRQNAVNPAPVSAATPAAVSQPVQETEALVGDQAQAGDQLKSATAPASAAPAPNDISTRSQSAPSGAPKPAAPKNARQTAAPAVAAQKAKPPALEHSWPSSAQSSPAVDNTPASATPDTISGRTEEARAPEPQSSPVPPEKTFEELVVGSNSVIGLQMETAVTSERARVEDRVEARVVRDVRVGSQVAIPAGARAVGSVMAVDRGGKFKDRARLGIRFHTIVLADGSQVPVSTETIYRYGEAPGNGSAAKVGGGAVAGAILGAIIGGAKGAAIGGTVGAGAGTAAVMAGDPSAATFPAGTEVTARFVSPVTVTVEK